MGRTYIIELDGQWYAFEGDVEHNQVYSIGADNPKEGVRWFAGWSEVGIKYVASSSPTRKAAYQKARRHGSYEGEIWGYKRRANR